MEIKESGRLGFSALMLIGRVIPHWYIENKSDSYGYFKVGYYFLPLLNL